MDLEAHGRHRAARELVSAYHHAGGSPPSEQLRSFYCAYWALVRAKVAVIAAGSQVTLETALARAAARMRSADRISDATPEVVAAQFHRFEGLDELPASGALQLDGEQSTDAQVLEVVRAVDERMRTAGFPQQKGGAYHPCPPR